MNSVLGKVYKAILKDYTISAIMIQLNNKGHLQAYSILGLTYDNVA